VSKVNDKMKYAKPSFKAVNQSGGLASLYKAKQSQYQNVALQNNDDWFKYMV